MDCKGKSRETPGDLIFKVSVVISCLHRPIVKNCQVPQPKRRASAPKRTSLPRVFVVTATATKHAAAIPDRATWTVRGAFDAPSTRVLPHSVESDTPKSWRRHYPPLCVFRLWLSVIARRNGGLLHASGPVMGRAWNRAPEVRVRNLGVDHRGNSPLRRLRHGLDHPRLGDTDTNGESWWCEECVRRTLQAIGSHSRPPKTDLDRNNISDSVTQQVRRFRVKIVGYVRVSTATQAEDGLGLDVQKAALRAWCKANGHRLTSILSDEGISGAKELEDRPGLADALDMIRAVRRRGSWCPGSTGWPVI